MADRRFFADNSVMEAAFPHHLETKLAHSGREDFAELGVHAPPLDLSSTYPLQDLAGGREAIDAWACGDAEASNPIYARLHNPTVARYEQAFAALEGGSDGVAFASGMAAIHAVLQSLRLHEMQEGVRRNKVVVVRPLYGCTDHLLASGLLGFETVFVDEADLADAVDEDTALVVLETPANPTLDLIDLRAGIAAAGDVPVMVDNTFATPVLQNPLRLGATFAVHSATKYLGGHGDVLAGIVATDATWAARLRQVRILTGGNLHPMAAWLLHRSLPTLALRVEKAQANAQVLAERLQGHARVESVHYPGLAACDPRGLIGAQMAGPGSVMAIRIDGGFEAAARVMRAVRLFTPAVSLGSTDSLIEHPAGLTHRIVGDAGREQGGITEDMLRLAVGIEHVEDLWRDLESALQAAAGVSAA
jgi:methionine-gamma-lyase